MSYLLLLPHIRIENANAVSGLTWGIPVDDPFSRLCPCAFSQSRG